MYSPFQIRFIPHGCGMTSAVIMALSAALIALSIDTLSVDWTSLLEPAGEE
jgi:hypothetical protein